MFNKGLQLSLAIVLLTAVVVVAHIIPGLNNSFVDANLRDGLHILGFACVAAIVFELTDAGPFGKALTAFVAAVVSGVIAEVAQSFTHQTFNVYDILRDAGGAAVYLVARLTWAWSSLPTRNQPGRISGRVAAVFVGALVTVPLLYWSAVLMSYRDRLPVVVDFAEAMDSRLATAVNSSIAFNAATGLAVVQLERSSWSGILVDVAASDWSGYQHLVVHLSMQDAPETRITVELSDGAHEGFRIQHLIGGDPVGADMMEVRFPLRGVRDVPGRPGLDLSKIRKVWVLGKHKGTTAVMRFNKIWLE